MVTHFFLGPLLLLLDCGAYGQIRLTFSPTTRDLRAIVLRLRGKYWSTSLDKSDLEFRFNERVAVVLLGHLLLFTSGKPDVSLDSI